jgi:hypothetical protein
MHSTMMNMGHHMSKLAHQGFFHKGVNGYEQNWDDVD